MGKHFQVFFFSLGVCSSHRTHVLAAFFTRTTYVFFTHVLVVVLAQEETRELFFLYRAALFIFCLTNSYR